MRNERKVPAPAEEGNVGVGLPHSNMTGIVSRLTVLIRQEGLARMTLFKSRCYEVYEIDQWTEHS